MKTIREYIGNNSYPGRGILVGMTKDNKAVVGYFISGRSENSRNRVFEADEAGDVFTKPFDESKVEDPSLIIYRAVAHIDGGLIVTNGDQTDTVAGSWPRESRHAMLSSPGSLNRTRLTLRRESAECLALAKRTASSTR